MKEKPLLLYLPGFDGTFLSPFLQFPELDTVFDVRCMTIGIEDRSSVEDLKRCVLSYIREQVKVDSSNKTNWVTNSTNIKFTRQKEKKRKTKQPRPLYLTGESFGGILACEVALEVLQDPNISLQGLALINPATCYYRSRLAVEGPIVAASNRWLYYFRLAGKLLPLFADEYSLDQLLMILRAEALPSVIDNEIREAYLGRVAFSLPFVIPVMQQGALLWRLSEWLDKGSIGIDRQLEQLAESSLRILLVVGEKDRTLPSIDEAERLASILRPDQLKIHVVEGAGHASTCLFRVDLASLFRQTFPRLRRVYRKEGKDEAQGWRWPMWRKERDGENEPIQTPRLSMKPVAAQGKGKYFGMEPRYDNATIGLSPLKYWSPSYYAHL
jgi:pimeloyl-ACP methyl ester carboxylesterase